MEIDIHVHTTASPCSILPPEKLVDLAVNRRQQFVVTTNHHDAYSDEERICRSLAGSDVLYFPGIEITNEWGDFLIFGEKLSDFCSRRDTFPVDLLPRDDIAVIWAHPYRFFSYRRVESVVSDVVPFIDAVEGINGNCILRDKSANVQAIQLARRLNKPVTAASDAHSADMYMLASTVFFDRIESYPDFINALKSGHYETKMM